MSKDTKSRLVFHLPRVGTESTARTEADTFLSVALERMQDAYEKTQGDDPAAESVAIYRTLRWLLIRTTNYAADGWTKGIVELKKHLTHELQEAVDFIEKNGIENSGCPSPTDAASALIISAGMMSHAVQHVLEGAHQPSELIESVSAGAIFGLLVRAFHQANNPNLTFEEFQAIAQRYFDDGCGLYRRELETERPLAAPVH